MQVISRKLLTTCPFEEYLKLPGWSHSAIKGFKGTPTKKMQLGTHVHNYLLTPEEYSYEDIDIVRPLAIALKQRIGPLIAYLVPELCVTATFVHNGFAMPYKGRGDLVIPRKIVIDLKITEMPLHKGIQYFGYDNQITGYNMGFDARVGLLMAINPKTKLISQVAVPVNSYWWEQQVITKGEPII